MAPARRGGEAGGRAAAPLRDVGRPDLAVALPHRGTWYGWVAVPALAYREWRQWPSKRWWDPALDAAFLVLGVLTATWSGAPLPLAAMRRRDWRTALTRLAPGVIRRPVSAER